MERYKRILGRTYFYSEDLENVPKKVKNNIERAVQIYWKRERFVGLCWVRGPMFTLITEKRIVAQKRDEMEQVLFQDIASIEKRGLNVSLFWGDSEMGCFDSHSQPPEKLVARFFEVAKKTWLEHKIG